MPNEKKYPLENINWQTYFHKLLSTNCIISNLINKPEEVQIKKARQQSRIAKLMGSRNRRLLLVLDKYLPPLHLSLTLERAKCLHITCFCASILREIVKKEMDFHYQLVSDNGIQHSISGKTSTRQHFFSKVSASSIGEYESTLRDTRTIVSGTCVENVDWRMQPNQEWTISATNHT